MKRYRLFGCHSQALLPGVGEGSVVELGVDEDERLPADPGEPRGSRADLLHESRRAGEDLGRDCCSSRNSQRARETTDAGRDQQEIVDFAEDAVALLQQQDGVRDAPFVNGTRMGVIARPMPVSVFCLPFSSLISVASFTGSSSLSI